MKFLDLNECENNALLEADICIVGSGPVGLSVAKEFAGTDVKILILESGGLHIEENSEKLYEIESVGDPRRINQRNLRCRIFGGSSHIWTGRCAPFDGLDFERRDWVPFSGWPFNQKELNPYMERAAINLGLGPHCYDESLWGKFKVSRPEPSLNTEVLSPFFWQFSKSPRSPHLSVDFGKDTFLDDADNITVLLHANVTQINTNDNVDKF
ncbi:MAG: hypothetical protein ACI9D5_001902 [Candidatus Endobugula sp.]|jgi:hypothetical protein